VLGPLGVGIEGLEPLQVDASLLSGCRNRIVTRADYFSICHYLDRNQAK
jgi:hypothetical protein